MVLQTGDNVASVQSPSQFCSVQLTGQVVTSMLMAPQDLAEPYLRTELLKFQKWQYSSLAKKLQLQVKEACYVMGVVDELGVLEEGEVFLKLPHLKSKYITGQVVITR